MNTRHTLQALALIGFLTLSMPALAVDSGHGGHDKPGASGHAGHGAAAADPHAGHGAQASDPHAGHQMEQGARMGEKVHESKVEGYTIAYHMIDNLARLKASGQQVDPSQVKSNHLMVYLTGPDGKAAEQGQVGYLVKNPDGSEQKAMTMGMAGGFGADVSLAAPGKYTIKTKAVVGGKTLLDEYTYERK